MCMKIFNYWAPVVSALILNVLLFIVVLSDSFRHILGIEGFYAGMITGIYVLILIPITAVLAGAISAVLFKESRLKAFAIALLSSFIFSGIALIINKSYQDQQLNKYYQENPLQRASTDPLNPLTIDSVIPLPMETNLGDTIDISVFAHDNLAVDGVISVRMEVIGKKILYRTTSDNIQVIDQEERVIEEFNITGLQKTRDFSSDGRSVYRGSVTVPLTMSDGTIIEQVRIFFADYTIDDAAGFVSLYLKK